ncbi:Diaminopimelate epimerase [Gossypium arboreum]|uniref:Diaminopimelate epimerase n=1 Tax=Gossypium arboreum TaxID=29729 RepID=A0A0B0P253_GOSAR|nr:Diaminopimelate epimerase [Gossypium arboreum]
MDFRMLRNPENWLFLRVWETGSDIDLDCHMGMCSARVEMVLVVWIFKSIHFVHFWPFFCSFCSPMLS